MCKHIHIIIMIQCTFDLIFFIFAEVLSISAQLVTRLPSLPILLFLAEIDMIRASCLISISDFLNFNKMQRKRPQLPHNNGTLWVKEKFSKIGLEQFSQNIRTTRNIRYFANMPSRWFCCKTVFPLQQYKLLSSLMLFDYHKIRRFIIILFYFISYFGFV